MYLWENGRIKLINHMFDLRQTLQENSIYDSLSVTFPHSAIHVPLDQSQTRILNSFGTRPVDIMLAVYCKNGADVTLSKKVFDQKIYYIFSLI